MREGTSPRTLVLTLLCDLESSLKERLALLPEYELLRGEGNDLVHCVRSHILVVRARSVREALDAHLCAQGLRRGGATLRAPLARAHDGGIAP